MFNVQEVFTPEVKHSDTSIVGNDKASMKQMSFLSIKNLSIVHLQKSEKDKLDNEDKQEVMRMS